MFCHAPNDRDKRPCARGSKDSVPRSPAAGNAGVLFGLLDAPIASRSLFISWVFNVRMTKIVHAIATSNGAAAEPEDRSPVDGGNHAGPATVDSSNGAVLAHVAEQIRDLQEQLAEADSIWAARSPRSTARTAAAP
jgi:hypothetical protein